MSRELNRNTLSQLPQQGRFVDESGISQNFADLIRKLTGAMDPFGALRTTAYQPIFSAQPLEVSIINDRTFTSGGASITVENGEYKLSRSAGETCRLESGQRGRYQPGLIGVPGIGVRRTTEPTGTLTYRYGYFDTDAGFGFQEKTDGLQTFVRQNGSEVYSKDRANWLDPLDGTGPSGRSINLLDGHIHRLPFAWYGYGALTFGILVQDSPDYDDEFIVIDRWAPSEGISFSNPNFPVTAEIVGDAAGEMYVAGRQYGVFGELNLRRRLVGELRTDQSIDAADGFVPCVSARVRQAMPWNRVPLQAEGVSMITDGNLDWIIVLGATLTNSGGTVDWNVSQFSQGDTSTEFNINADGMTGGEILGGPRFAQGGGGLNVGRDSADIPAQDIPVGEPVTLAVRSNSGVITVRSSLRTAELR